MLSALLLAGAKKWKIRTGKTRLCRMGQHPTSVTLPCSWQSDAEGRNGAAVVRGDLGSSRGRAAGLPLAALGQGASPFPWQGGEQGPRQPSCLMGGTD